jgi:sugar fermentation stimulation protein A
MRYDSIREAIFIERPNRFIAHVLLDGAPVVCHVKNTGRCRELLVPEARVVLSYSTNPLRKTAYDLVSVYKGERLINMDSQAPNAIAAEYLPRLFPDLTELRREVSWGDSRFDFYGVKGDRPFYLEVKGVTLERDGRVLFPDAPTERGAKHLRELKKLRQAGTDAYVLFVIQMQDVLSLEANRETDPTFAGALLAARAAGVGVYAVDCLVTPDSVTARMPVPVLFL